MPKAIRKTIPPSIGTQGGGQQAGVPVEPPVGGGAGAEKIRLAVKRIKRVSMNLIFFIIVCKCIKNLEHQQHCH